MRLTVQERKELLKLEKQIPHKGVSTRIKIILALDLLIIDNATYYKNKDVQAYLANPDCRIKLIFLPPDSPNLNFIERLWNGDRYPLKYMKEYIIGVKYREKFKEFEDDILHFFDNIDQHDEKLRHFIGTELHLVNEGIIPRKLLFKSENHFRKCI